MRQIPEPGSCSLRIAGIPLNISLDVPNHFPVGRAFLRTNLSGTWRDLPMSRTSSNASHSTWSLSLSGQSPSFSHFKAYFLPNPTPSLPSPEPLWQTGPNASLKIAPAWTLRSCSVYTAFVRQFRFDAPPANPKDSASLSGTFRALIRQLPHITRTLGFHILQLLPIHPVPSAYARMGEYGSPFASLDFYNVDPALAEFDPSATPLDQFIELVDATHAHGARIFLDLPANHTGWASQLQTHHPNWFRRNKDGSFHSPGAWGVVWEDLVELDYNAPDLIDEIANVFRFWCEKGVDGFRCDAGYMIPAAAWLKIVRHVRSVFPDTVFLLEGLGGRIEVTDDLLTNSGLDWAYSEIFQEQDRNALTNYLSSAIPRSQSSGPLINFAETHDNNRLASQGTTYSSLRTALAALISQQGAFGITAGVEWFCRNKIDVHGAAPLAWNNPENQIALISRLNAVLDTHPAFSAGTHIDLVTSGGGNTLAALRTPLSDSHSKLLVAFNLDCNAPATVSWPANSFSPSLAYDLLTGLPAPLSITNNSASISLPPGGFVALSPSLSAIATVEQYEQTRRSATLPTPPALIPSLPATQSAPPAFLHYTHPIDASRTLLLPPGYALKIQSPHPFRALLLDTAGRAFASCIALPPSTSAPTYSAFLLIPPEITKQAALREFRASLLFINFHGEQIAKRTLTPLRILPPGNSASLNLCLTGDAIIKTTNNYHLPTPTFHRASSEDSCAVLANRRGAMAQVLAAFSEIRSQYDALLAINPNPEVPANKQIFLSRCKVWIRRMGHSVALDRSNLVSFSLLNLLECKWQFRCDLGDDFIVSVTASLALSNAANAASLSFHCNLPPNAQNSVSIIVRPDVEARDFHSPTLAYTGPERSYPAAVRPEPNGFRFELPTAIPCALRSPSGIFHHDPLWTYNVPHPLEAERGLHPCGDLFSPGWFSAPLNAPFTLLFGTTAEIAAAPLPLPSPPPSPAPIPLSDWLRQSLHLFIADRDEFQTVIAGYPWFLDWGRDTLIFLRGLIAARELKPACAILGEFARFVDRGTLPNIIHGTTVGNRDTSDAPLWFVIALGDLCAASAPKSTLKSLLPCARTIIEGYLAGTPNGIRVDLNSGLVFSPSHFTWMDTNYPAGTPRTGYPVEIQALWIAALTTLRTHFNICDFTTIESTARASLLHFFSLPDGYLADNLRSPTNHFTPAAHCTPEDALRPNQLLAITLGAIDRSSDKGIAIARTIVNATEHLIIPGAIRSLADAPVQIPQRIVDASGHSLNDPHRPYWGHYLGDEDTRRKPAYHNGTAWGWQFPLWCEAFALTTGDHPAALSLLASCTSLLECGCLGHLPEIVDGDAPHTQRGCLAQAWSNSEHFRVLSLLHPPA